MYPSSSPTSKFVFLLKKKVNPAHLFYSWLVHCDSALTLCETQQKTHAVQVAVRAKSGGPLLRAGVPRHSIPVRSVD